jgi:hypothetical protein
MQRANAYRFMVIRISLRKSKIDLRIRFRARRANGFV